MKRWKVNALAALSVTLLIPVPAYAQGWEKNENGTYSYLDENDSRVTDSWKKVDGKFYYFDEKGYMATSRLIDSGGNLYFVDKDGVMVENDWRKDESNEDDDMGHYWYYFGSGGKAYMGTDGYARPKEINGKKYIFDDKGHMLTGWVNEDLSQADDAGPSSVDEPWKTGLYYCGGEDDGAVHIGMEKIGSYWYYFKSNGKKAQSEKLTIRDDKGVSNTYSFDKYGARIQNKFVAKNEYVVMDEEDEEDEEEESEGTVDIRKHNYYHGSNGVVVKNAWVNATPNSAMNADDYNEGTKRWFWAEPTGRILTDKIKQIDGKFYCFDEAGIMRSGLVALENGRYSYTLQNTNPEDDITTTREMLVEAVVENGERVQYFDQTTGARVTGKTRIELEDGTFDFLFDNSGDAVTGVKDGYLYEAGILMKDYDKEEEKIREVTVNERTYRVNRSGKVVKK